MGGFQGRAGSLRALLLPRLFFQHFADTRYVVERVDGELVAFLIGFLSHVQPDVAYIHFVGVDPAHRRAGLGATLYRAFFEHVAQLGARTVKCITSPGNETSVAFHTGLGFALEPSESVTDDVPVQRDYDGPGLDRIAFKRTLRDPRAPALPEATGEYVRAETDLTALLRGLTARRNTGVYVYVRVSAVPEGAEPVVVVKEAEGTTSCCARSKLMHLGSPTTSWLRGSRCRSTPGLTRSALRLL